MNRVLVLESDRASFAAAQTRALPAQGRWIADGNYAGTLDLCLALADTVIFLDAGTAVCLYRVLRRTVSQLGRERADQAPGCHERLFHPGYLEFLRYVASFNRKKRPLLLERVAAFPRRFVLRPDQVEGFLSTVPLVARRADAD